MTAQTSVQAIEQGDAKRVARSRSKLTWFDKLCALLVFTCGALLIGLSIIGLFVGVENRPELRWLCIPGFFLGWGMTVTFLKLWFRCPRQDR